MTHMTLSEYQERSRATAFYPEAGTGSVNAQTYVALGLNGEAGEVAELMKKSIRDGYDFSSGEKRERLRGELGDVLWYVAQMAREAGLSLEAIALANIAKLEGRAERGTLGGSGEDR